MADKIFRDPLYDYISIDRERDGWLLDLLACPEVQRLRRIHQLGVSSYTYPGADHNRLVHSLGVVHLMQQALRHLEATTDAEQVKTARQPLLAVALLHDVGHGPFSHLFEPCLGIDHEEWSKQIVLDPATKVYEVLRRQSKFLPQHVADLIDEDNRDHPAWQKSLLSSQLDMDRLDYLRRDSLFTGAGYGHFDQFRIVNTIQLHSDEDGADLVWPEKSGFAIEEYVFARFYMYQNVYLHKTTRGFEKLLEAMWRRASAIRAGNGDVRPVPVLADFWAAGKKASTAQYLQIEEFTVLQQIQAWCDHPDKALSDLARRFLQRDGFAMIDPPPSKNALAVVDPEWETALKDLVKDRTGLDPEMYCLVDTLKGKYKQPYFPEKQKDEQSVKNAIRILSGGAPVEISEMMPRLKPLTQKPPDQRRYYVPKEVREYAEALAKKWK